MTDPTPIDPTGPPGQNGRQTVGGARAVVFTFVAALLVLAALALLPPRRHRGETPSRVKCASRLRQIGLATQMHFEARGQMPRRLSDLLDQDVLPDMFICPAGTQKPLTWDQLRSDPRMLDDPTWSSYTYIPLTPEQRIPENVLAFETVEHRHGQGVNVVFGDGHVEWIGGREVVQQLRDDHAAGVRPLRFRPVRPTTR